MGWGGMVQMIADRVGVELDEIRESFDRYYTPEAFDTPMMHVPKDTCSAVRFQLEGMAHGRPVTMQRCTPGRPSGGIGQSGAGHRPGHAPDHA